MGQNGKILYLFTNKYPYGSGESFLENEIIITAANFNKVVIFPRIASDKHIRAVPDNVEVVNLFDASFSYSSSQVFFKYVLRILKIIFIEFSHTSKKAFFLKKIRKWNSVLCQNINISNHLKKHLQNRNEKELQPVFYSYWMNDWALVCALLKDEQAIDNFVFRVLGFDIYDERNEGGYNPFQYYNFSKTNKVITVSQNAMNYLKAKQIFAEKITYSYFGTTDFGRSNLDSTADFTIYSCSNIIPLKRVRLIAESLKIIPFKIKWIHRGDGPLKADLVNFVKELPENVNFELLGRVDDYSEVLSFIKNSSINLFVNVSESEGLPVSIMEAISFGIPILATDVGGTAEIVTEQTGVLLQKNVDATELAKQISLFKDSKMNTLEFRKGVREYWNKNFVASENYQRFCDLITGKK